MKFKELATVKASDSKDIVISKFGDEGYTIAQKAYYVDDEGKQNSLFLKGGIHFNNINNLKLFVEVLQDVLKVVNS